MQSQPSSSSSSSSSAAISSKMTESKSLTVPVSSSSSSSSSSSGFGTAQRRYPHSKVMSDIYFRELLAFLIPDLRDATDRLHVYQDAATYAAATKSSVVSHEVKEEKETNFNFKKAGVSVENANSLLAHVNALIYDFEKNKIIFTEYRRQKISEKIYILECEAGMNIYAVRDSLNALSTHLKGGIDYIETLTVEHLQVGLALRNISLSHITVIPKFATSYNARKKIHVRLLELKNSPYSYSKLKALMLPFKKIAETINKELYVINPEYGESDENALRRNLPPIVLKEQTILNYLTDDSVSATEVASNFHARAAIESFDLRQHGFSIRYRSLINLFYEMPEKLSVAFNLIYQIGLLQYDFINDKLLIDIMHGLMRFSIKVLSIVLNSVVERTTHPLRNLFDGTDSLSVHNRLRAFIFLVMDGVNIRDCLPGGTPAVYSIIINPHGHQLAESQWFLHHNFNYHDFPLDRYHAWCKAHPDSEPFAADIAIAMNEFCIFRKLLNQPLQQGDLNLLSQHKERALYIAWLTCIVTHIFDKFNCMIPRLDLEKICNIVDEADENRLFRLMQLIRIAILKQLFYYSRTFDILWDYSAREDSLTHFERIGSITTSSEPDLSIEFKIDASEPSIRARLFLESVTNQCDLAVLREAHGLLFAPCAMWRPAILRDVAPIVCGYVAEEPKAEAQVAKVF